MKESNEKMEMDSIRVAKKDRHPSTKDDGLRRSNPDWRDYFQM